VRTGPKAKLGLAESTGNGPTGSEVDKSPRLAIAPGQAVAVSPGKAAPAPGTPAATAPAAPEAQPVSTTPAAPATTPAAAPLATTAEGAKPGGGPVAAGVGGFEESCEGDEYLLTITLLDEETVGDESPVDIVLARLNEDGTTGDELHLEGDLNDARSLASTLGSEGSCVKVEIAQPEAEESGEEIPGAGEEAPEPGEEVAEPAESSVPSSP
jgi:hypothetical protein